MTLQHAASYGDPRSARIEADVPPERPPELRRHPLAAALAILYASLNCQAHVGIGIRIINRITRLEGGQFFSATARQIIERYHQVKVGAYSYGPCLEPGAFPAGVTVKRYVSIARNVHVSLLNKPMDRLSMHPVFYDSGLNGGTETGIEYLVPLVIEDDAWVGEGALILPGCRRIGLGAVVGGGAVVTHDVPDFAVVGGNPARIIRYRFPADIQDVIRASGWWERSLVDCQGFLSEMAKPVSSALATHPLLKAVVLKR